MPPVNICVGMNDNKHTHVQRYCNRHMTQAKWSSGQVLKYGQQNSCVHRHYDSRVSSGNSTEEIFFLFYFAIHCWYTPPINLCMGVVSYHLSCNTQTALTLKVAFLTQAKRGTILLNYSADLGVVRPVKHLP